MQQELSEYGKLDQMLQVYERVLHPDFFNALKQQLFKAFEENKKDAYANAKISDEALAIEKEINEFKTRLYQFENHPELKSFHLKVLFKKLIKMFL